MISRPTRHNILSTHIPQDHRPYHIPSRSTGFIVPTHTTTHRRPNIPTLDRFALSLNILSISDLHGGTNMSKAPTVSVLLCLKYRWSSVRSVLVLDMRYQHSSVTVLATRSQHNTQCTLCAAHESPSPPRLDWTGQINEGGVLRHPFHCTFIMLLC